MAEARALYRDLKRVESQLNRAQTADDLRYIAAQEGSRVGYKTLALLLTGRTTPEKLRPSEVPYEQALALYDVSAPPDLAAIVNAPDFFPDDLGAYNHQVDGIGFLVGQEGALLGDEMGLGKTVQTIGALKVLFERGEIDRALILAPRTLVNQWAGEFEKWAPELYVRRVQGSPLERRYLWRSGATVLLAGLETWRNDYSELGPDLRSFDVVVVDEIQRIKEGRTAIAQAVRQVRARRRWGLSGTPIENRIDDIVQIYNFLLPHLFSDEEAPYDSAEVKQRIQPYFLRRRIVDSGVVLPDKTEREVWLELGECQRKAYESLEGEARRQLSQPGATRMHVFSEINHLKQICNYDDSSGESSKLEYLAGELDTVVANDQKALVFSQYPKKTLAQLQERLATYDPALYHGDLSDREADRLCKAFQEQPSPRVLLISVRTGATGLNLTGASHVFHFDHWWNPAIIRQATARAHRLGQKRPVFVHSLFTRNTIEEKVHELLRRKQNLFDEVVDDLTQEDIASYLTDADLFSLFGLEPPSRGRPKPKKLRSYQATAPYRSLKQVQEELADAETAQEVRAIARTYCPIIGNKSFVLLLSGASTPELMRWEEYLQLQLEAGEEE